MADAIWRRQARDRFPLFGSALGIPCLLVNVRDRFVHGTHAGQLLQTGPIQFDGLRIFLLRCLNVGNEQHFVRRAWRNLLQLLEREPRAAFVALPEDVPCSWIQRVELGELYELATRFI